MSASVDFEHHDVLVKIQSVKQIESDHVLSVNSCLQCCCIVDHAELNARHLCDHCGEATAEFAHPVRCALGGGPSPTSS